MTSFKFAAIAALAVASAASIAAPTELLVKYKPGMSPRLANALVGAKTVRDYPQIGWQLVRLPANANKARAIRVLGASVGVAKVSDPVPMNAVGVAPNDPKYTDQYHHAIIDTPSAWAYSVGSPEVTVAICDTGVRMTHEDLSTQVRTDGYDTFNGDNDPTDDGGHGTHVAGDAAATTNNGLGVASPAWNVRILPVKVLGPSGGSDVTVGEGVMYAADHGAQIINLSLGGGGSDFLNESMQYAYSAGSVVVAAAGNAGSTSKFYPAAYDNVVSVGASNASDVRAGFSNYGDWVRVAAPGENILSTTFDSDSTYGYASGTSMACPVTSGVLALMLSYAPGTPNDELMRVLYTTANSTTYVNPDPSGEPWTHFGRIDAANALANIIRPIVHDLAADDAAVYATTAGNEGTQTNSTGSGATDSAKLSSDDGVTFTINSMFRKGEGGYASLDAQLPMTGINMSEVLAAHLHLTIRAKSQVTALVFVENPATGKMVQLDAFGLSSTDRVWDKRITPAQLAAYGANGSVRIVVRTINPVRFGGSGVSYRADFDSLSMVVTTRAIRSN